MFSDEKGHGGQLCVPKLGHFPQDFPLWAIGGIIFPHIKGTEFLTIYQSICCKVFNNLRLSLNKRFGISTH
jgi:hypothetical protein